MAQEVKLRRGTANQHVTFTGAVGEVTVDTTNKTLRVHDASTVGGIRLAKYSDLGAAANLQSIPTNVSPSANLTYDLGSTEKRWRNLYLSGNTISLGNTNISISDDSIRFSNAANNDVAIQVSSLTVGGNTTSTITGNVTITRLILQNVLGTTYGGTGLSSFTQDGILFGKTTSTLGFVSGSSGEILQLAANGTPVFDDMDGGTF